MGNIYHILNRGVNKDPIFLGTNDYLRFIYCLHRFNNRGRRLGEREDPKEYLKDPPPQDKLVNILKWSLMPNHYHILVEEVVEGGALKFVQRVIAGLIIF
ncbi:hypothetical protein C4572_00860 [Candidatus Parcubacteria bacterium]|nr:MAG: hypothetical protein C4572_00860 [Candidatus Parcubacteria bacterium]